MHTILTSAASGGISSYISIIVALLVFSILVLVHELGHFLAAKQAGITVNEFAIGMGPKIISYKKGETLYSIRLFPIGGFCAMGEDDDSYDEGSFNNKSILQRATVIVAGSFFNLIFAFICCFFILSNYGFAMPEVQEFSNRYNLSETGIQKGDRIVQLDNTDINLYEDIELFMHGSNGAPVDITVLRDGKEYVYEVTPKDYGEGYKFGFVPGRKLGVNHEIPKDAEMLKKATLGETVKMSFLTMQYYIKSTVIGFVRIITFNVAKEEVAGPIGIVNIIGEAYEENIEVSVSVTIASLLQIAGILSANLGAINLMPIPAMDGGRLVFIILEAIRGKRIPPEKEGYVHAVGFMCLIGLMIYIAFNDVIRILG